MKMNFATKRAPLKLTAVPTTEDEIALFKDLLGDETCDFYIMWPMALNDIIKINEYTVQETVKNLVVDPDTEELLFQDGVEMNHTVFYKPMSLAIVEELGKLRGKR